MTTLSFGEAAALTYIAKRTDLTFAERSKLTKGLSKRGKKIAKVLHAGKPTRSGTRAKILADC